jgi:hypothetical protein
MVLYRLWKFSHKREHPKSAPHYFSLPLLVGYSHVKAFQWKKLAVKYVFEHIYTRLGPQLTLLALNFAKGPKRKRSNIIDFECWDTSFGPFLWKEGIVDQHLGFRTNDSHSERAKRGSMWGWTAWGWDVGVSMQFFWPQKSVAYTVYIFISYHICEK